jgi:phosphoribosylformimino-5-aminoimidazole carboxamide ribotide isomerase
VSIGSGPQAFRSREPVFELLPAIDLRAGRVVRLRAGDLATETVFGDDPVEVARGFSAAGASWLHVVDLDGARSGRRRQAELVVRIVAAVGEGVACEVAGGLRDADAVAAALAGGARRVALGTAALRRPRLAGELVATHGANQIVVALDVRDGLAVGDGWQAGAAGVPVDGALGRLADEGVVTFEVTAIARDGGLAGPDQALLERLVRLDRGRIIASGGIRSIDDLLAVRGLGCAGAIVGRALYEGGLDLAAAVAALKKVD